MSLTGMSPGTILTIEFIALSGFMFGSGLGLFLFPF